ncbi:MAG: heavy metal-binding domain-containing protein, partial [Candidatus Acidiferrales bacterium]
MAHNHPTGAEKDPVCGMMVDPGRAAGKHDYRGKTYYFCNPRCLEKFRAQPEKYLASGPLVSFRGPTQARVPALAPPSSAIYTCPMDPEVRQPRPGPCPKCGMALEPMGAPEPSVRTEYVCPMHPEIVRDRPGACPICGMALEPRTVTLEEEENPELTDMRRRFWVGVALTAPVFFLAMSDLIPGQPVQHALSPALIHWIQLVLATPVVLWGGRPFFERGWASVVNRSPNMFTLIAIGTGTAYAYSLVATLAPGIFPDSFRGHGGAVAVYYEAAAVITTLVLLGQVLELRARAQTSSALRALLGLAPKTARRIDADGSEAD